MALTDALQAVCAIYTGDDITKEAMLERVKVRLSSNQNERG